MNNHDLDQLSREIETDRAMHGGNSYDLKDDRLAVLLDGLLELGLIDESAMLARALYPDPATFELMNRGHLLAHASRWARDRVRELDGEPPINPKTPTPPPPAPIASAPPKKTTRAKKRSAR